MAEAEQIDGSVEPPTGPNSSSYGEIYVNEETGRLVSLEGVEAFIPAGFTKLIMQPRKCGDHYAELVGQRSFAAFGPSRSDALRAVIARAEQVSAS